MSAYLLDANVMIALAWPDHSDHGLAGRWFAGHASRGWATCPLTQMALVRTLSNPSFSENAITPADAMLLLGRSLAHPAHQFWSDAINLQEALQLVSAKIAGHRQITDAYLIALAVHNKGRLATMDRGIARLAPNAVEVIA